MNVPILDSFNERPRGITEVVYERLYTAITEHQLAPGEPLTEQALAERLQVSKTPVREAMLRLRQVGLIEADGKRGVRVVKLTPSGLRDTIEMREALEVYCASRAAERITRAAGEDLMEAAIASLRSAEKGDSLEYHHNDRRFHSIIANIVGNPVMKEQIQQAVSVVRTGVRGITISAGSQMVACGNDHVRIANAICAGSRDIAAREMAAHIRHVHDLIVTNQVVNEGGKELEFAR